MRSLFLVLAVCGLYGVIAQDVPAMPRIEEGGMLPQMQPGIVMPPEVMPPEEDTSAAEPEVPNSGSGVHEEQSNDEPEQEESLDSAEKILIRCKRPMCKMYCPYGFRSGSDGCPTCSCLENPCNVVDCDPGTICRPKKCQEESCSVLEAECIELPSDCPLRKCVRNCDSGYVKDKRGCRTCECLEEPGPMPCAMPMCASFCPFGMQNDENGCMTCKCNEEPLDCGSMTCEEDLQCFMKKPKACDTCKPVPKCTVPSLCSSLQALREGFKVDSATAVMPPDMDPFHKPVCRDDGTFAPTQCHQPSQECWCVDDRGREVEGSRVAGSLECAENTTSALHISFVLVHEFGEDELLLMIQSQDIHIVIQENLGKWLSMDKNNVVVVSVIPNGDTIIVETVLISDGVTDLPSAANHLGNRMNKGKCDIDYRGKTVKPKPDSVNVHYQYRKPQLPHGGGVHEWKSFCRKHRSAMIAGLVGLLIFLVMMLTLIVYVCKRRRSASAQFAHKRFENMENFKKNLIHSRDWEQPDLVVADKENKNVQLISKEPLA